MGNPKDLWLLSHTDASALSCTQNVYHAGVRIAQVLDRSLPCRPPVCRRALSYTNYDVPTAHSRILCHAALSSVAPHAPLLPPTSLSPSCAVDNVSNARRKLAPTTTTYPPHRHYRPLLRDETGLRENPCWAGGAPPSDGGSPASEETLTMLTLIR